VRVCYSGRSSHFASGAFPLSQRSFRQQSRKRPGDFDPGAYTRFKRQFTQQFAKQADNKQEQLTRRQSLRPPTNRVPRPGSSFPQSALNRSGRIDCVNRRMLVRPSSFSQVSGAIFWVSVSQWELQGWHMTDLHAVHRFRGVDAQIRSRDQWTWGAVDLSERNNARIGWQQFFFLPSLRRKSWQWGAL
jgi:hypothetical protein